MKEREIGVRVIPSTLLYWKFFDQSGASIFPHPYPRDRFEGKPPFLSTQAELDGLQDELSSLWLLQKTFRIKDFFILLKE